MVWDIPKNDPVEADKLIFKTVHEALSEIENNE